MEVLVAFAAVLAIALAALWFSARSAITILVAEVSDGELTVVKGGISPRVLADLRDVVKRPKVRRAQLRIMRRKDRAEVLVTGSISDAQAQQLRNVVGTVPLAKLTNARSKK